jgi:uncharacterized protein (TIGR02270 family)
VINSVVEQHADEAAMLYLHHTILCHAPHVTLRDLRRLDDRLAAHLDGLAIAGEHAWPFCEAALDPPSPGPVFTAAIGAIAERDQAKLDRLFALAKASPVSVNGLKSAFGWLEGEQLKGIVAVLLGSEDWLRRAVGIAACAMHRVDPGIISARRLQDPAAEVRARALRAVGEIGCADAGPACVAAIRDEDSECRFWSAWSSVLLGNRGDALQSLTDACLHSNPRRPRAFCVALQAMSVGAGHDVLRQLTQDAVELRWLIQGAGIVGDPTYVPWLSNHMRVAKTARLAAEAFTLITGADLRVLHVEGERPENFESGPNDDPEDPNVDMDPDDGLPWPNVEKIEQWWMANSVRFQKGRRYFMGAPVTRGHCIDVLKNGYQRQRILAAHYLCLLEPGTPLFNTSAPAWRQQRLLAKMT